MPVTFYTASLGNFKTNSVTLNETRVRRLMSENKEEALYMGLWDRFCDLFRPQKKAEVLGALWNLMHPEQENGTPAVSGSREESKGALDAFQKLRALSDTPEAFTARLTTEMSGGEYTVHVNFSIKGESVRETDYFCSPDRVDLSGFDLRGSDLRCADLTRANLRGADLTSADLKGAKLNDANLIGADLTGADQRVADLTRANLTRANLIWANLTGANLTGANLTGANLTGANLSGANLTGVSLTGVSLIMTDLTLTNLTQATCNSRPLTQANFDEYFPQAFGTETIRWQSA